MILIWIIATINMYFFDHKYPKAEDTDLKSYSNELNQQLLIVTISSNKVIHPQDYCADHICQLLNYSH